MSSLPAHPVSAFCRRHFRHFNAASLVRAADAYCTMIQTGGKMVVSLAGAMSTGEIGLSLSEMIRRGKVHAISCTAANLEEDVFNLLAHHSFESVTNYRELSVAEEVALQSRGMNRVTDTCIPESAAIRRLQSLLLEKWKAAADSRVSKLPHEYFYETVLDPRLAPLFDIDPAESWVHAAALVRLPLYVPGWEDSSMGSIFAAATLRGEVASLEIVRSGIHYLLDLAAWYESQSRLGPLGLLQVGGGLAGDFAISVVPLLREDLERDVPLWSYFCQISDSTTSYGSYSGAPPAEKISWGKIGPGTPRFVIESDASIVLPLLFARVLGW